MSSIKKCLTCANRVMIKIVDRETKKVIKEIPPEKSLDMLERAWEIAGILMDEKR